MLVKYFSDIPNNKLPGDDFSKWNHLNAFQDIFTDKIYVVKPVANVTKLDITFCLESFAREYKTKPHYFTAYLLGYEGTGSLTSYLREKFVFSVFFLLSKQQNQIFQFEQKLGIRINYWRGRFRFWKQRILLTIFNYRFSYRQRHEPY